MEYSSSTGSYSEEYEVRVHAMVMERHDLGWKPLGSGGHSLVILRKVPIIGKAGEEVCYNYIIHGHKDQSEVLRCILTKDVQYMRATPTFHHWEVDGRKYGLVFKTKIEAEKFETSIGGAVKVLSDAPEVPYYIRLAAAEEAAFDMGMSMARKSSLSPSESTISTTTSSPPPHSPSKLTLHDVVPCHASLYSSSSRPVSSVQPSDRRFARSKAKSSLMAEECVEEMWAKHDSVPPERSELIELIDRKCSMYKSSGETAPQDLRGGGDFSYVHFDKNIEGGKQAVTPKDCLKHDYSYPSLGDSISVSSSKPMLRSSSMPPFSTSSSTEPLKIRNLRDQNRDPPLPSKSRRDKNKSNKKKLLPEQTQPQAKCLYCSEMYTVSENVKGACLDAPPDFPARCLDRVTCLCCTRAVLYHCVADADNQDYTNPCICDTSDEKNCLKWTVLTVMSLFIPCLWCYWPLHGCYRCGVRCQCCGGKHKPTM